MNYAKNISTEDQMMMASNIFLLSPVIIAGIQGEWLYLLFASGIMICSPLFHWYRIVANGSHRYIISRIADWSFATGAFVYMYWYVYHHDASYKAIVYVLLTSALAFFWYGWRYGNYRMLHPWFHLVGAGVSSLILLL